MVCLGKKCIQDSLAFAADCESDRVRPHLRRFPKFLSVLHLRAPQIEIKTSRMKISAPYLRRITAAVIGASIAFAAPSLLAQTTATTDPVGFITLNVAGTGGAGGSSLSFRGLSLTRPVEYQGSAESVSTNSVTDNEAAWTDNQFNGANGAYFLEITSGPGAGSTYDITATTAATKTVTLAQNLGAGIAAPVVFKIRKHWTIAAVFGAANE